MFDEENKNQNIPSNLPTEPADMFAGVENSTGEKMAGSSMPNALSNGLLKKKDRVITPPNISSMNEGDTHMGDYKMSSPILGKVLLVVVIMVLLGGLAYGGWWLFGAGNKNESLPPTSENGQNNTGQNQIPTDSTANIPNQISNDQILFGQGVDVDNDSLDEVREKEIGTNPQNADTDSDGLNDGDEVITHKSNPLNADTDNDGLSDGDEYLIWKTDLLNPDSDGDTYPDGTEVKNGYSPLGPGKLFNLPATQASSSISVSTT